MKASDPLNKAGAKESVLIVFFRGSTCWLVLSKTDLVTYRFSTLSAYLTDQLSKTAKRLFSGLQSKINTLINRIKTMKTPENKIIEAPENTVELDTPITRGNQTISAITLRKPKAGELRGVKLGELLQMDVETLAKVLPRISSPILTTQDVNNLDPADLLQLAGVAAGFLLQKANKPDYPLA
ncbi:phage tail assembly protein [Iodobacter sp.]|uniref:phage tail assembly protein n=1 Tax=Iodobacter sp. TaxID=1915058 RepID=UPI0025DD54AA|nr:phage tail assembly protein [Iodobacter sp.]